MSNEVALDIQHLTKRFGKLTILEDVSLTVASGEVVAVIGPSGAGKSTLLRCVNYLHPFERGQITILGRKLHGIEVGPAPDRKSLTDIRSQVGMVFQRFNLFPHLTALENVILGPMEVSGTSRDEAVADAERLLDLVGLKAKRDVYPRRLSGGQQQRVAICRALAMHPKLMLFDEPTSALDPELVGDVLAVIRQLADDGMTMLLATHEMSFARDVADTVIFMANKRIVETGPARDVLTSPKEERTRTFLRRVLEQEAAGDSEDTVEV